MRVELQAANRSPVKEEQQDSRLPQAAAAVIEGASVSPGRSSNWNQKCYTRFWILEPTSTVVRWMLIVKIACEREDRSFSLVLLVERLIMQSS
jgi:hypothetical protein